jgi:hypothetical protein
MPKGDAGQAESLLTTLVGKAVITSEASEYQLRIVFDKSLEFVVSSPWRITLRGVLLGGSGDVGGVIANTVLSSLKGLEIISASVLPSWDTRLVLQSEYVLEVIPDSVQYETWQAHLEAGWVIFAGGAVTVFPPAAKVDELIRRRPRLPAPSELACSSDQCSEGKAKGGWHALPHHPNERR